MALSANGKVAAAATRSWSLMDQLVAWTSEEKRTTSTAGDASFKVWDTRSGAILRRIDKQVRHAALSRDGRLAILLLENALEVWDLQSGVAVRKIGLKQGVASGVTVTHDGRIAASWGANDAILLWDVASGRCVREIPAIDVSCIDLTPDGRFVLVASGGGEFTGENSVLQIWDVVNGTCLRTFEDHVGGVAGVALSEDGSLVASAGRNGEMRVRDLISGNSVRSIQGVAGTAFFTALRGCRTGVSLGLDGFIRVWNLSSGMVPAEPPRHGDSFASPSMEPIGTGGRPDDRFLAEVSAARCDVGGVAMSLDGTTVVSAGSDFTLRVWSVRTGGVNRACGTISTSTPPTTCR